MPAIQQPSTLAKASGMERVFECFVIMPFSETEHGKTPNQRKISAVQWTYIYEKWIKRAVESYSSTKLKCKRSPAQPGNFVKGIVQDLSTADLVIADLTGQRPNVYYELGIRHAHKVGTIMITQDLSALPSDLHGYYAFQYEYSDKAHEEEVYFRAFEKELHEKMQFIESAEDISDSPVSDFLGVRDKLMEKSLEQDQDELIFILTELRKECYRNFDVAGTLEKVFAGENANFPEGVPLIDLFLVEVLYTRLVSYSWKAIPKESLTLVVGIVRDLHLRFRRLDRHLMQIELTKGGDPTLQEYIKSIFSELKGQREHMEANWQGVIDSVGTMMVKKGSG
jgi:hypothetical protein